VVFHERQTDRSAPWDSQQGTSDPGARSRHRAGTDARLAKKKGTMKKTNFDRYLDKQLRDPAFAARFKHAGEAWDVALQISALREKAGLTQQDLAKLLGTSQQQISRLESPGYEGHSLSMLRRVAEVLHAKVRVAFEPAEAKRSMRVAERPARYGIKRRTNRRK
jgi:DNA-binding XRE family transcriptional regulator